MSRTIATAGVVGLLAVVLAVPAGAQFDPAFNHLECYTIKTQGGGFVRRAVTVETQFGPAPGVEVLKPVRLCAPARKAGGGPDPLPPTAVPHFLCYKVKTKLNPRRDVRLTDQFGTLLETVFRPNLLCTPATKELIP